MIAGAATIENLAILVILSLMILIVYTLWWGFNVGIRKLAKWRFMEVKK